jgi:hypothetical protein
MGRQKIPNVMAENNQIINFLLISPCTQFNPVSGVFNFSKKIIYACLGIHLDV